MEPNKNKPNIVNLGTSKLPGKGYWPIKMDISVSDDESRKKRLSAYAEKIKAIQEEKK